MPHVQWNPTAAAIAATCAVVVVLLVLAADGWMPPARPVSVAFDGVELSIAYTGTSQPIFGPAEQNACLEAPIVTPGGLRGPDCPSNLTGGTQYSFPIFELAVPVNNFSAVFLNLSLTSPVPFRQSLCSLPGPPVVGPETSVLSAELPAGTVCGWNVVLGVPSPPPASSGGLWLGASLTAHFV